MTTGRRGTRVRRWRATGFALSLVLTTATALVAIVGGGPLALQAPRAEAVANRVDGFLSAAEHSAGGTEVPEDPAEVTGAVAVPDQSGHGRRVVFDEGAQRVWLVQRDGSVRATYLVSGSRYDNLRAGHYEVYSRSRHATAFDYESTMQYFVRFAEGASAAIGFHDIPVDDSGQQVQTSEQLGTPLSAGCIRQRRADAKLMWAFATVGTPVIVT